MTPDETASAVVPTPSTNAFPTVAMPDQQY